jgi:hypothetical protein
MALQYLKKDGVFVQPAPFLFSSEAAAPLSWHLTKPQLKAIHDAWDASLNANSRKVVYTQLGCGG